jgi:hypothetical protein
MLCFLTMEESCSCLDPTCRSNGSKCTGKEAIESISAHIVFDFITVGIPVKRGEKERSVCK